MRTFCWFVLTFLSISVGVSAKQPYWPKIEETRQAAEAGDTTAQRRLGDFYSSQADYTTAGMWYRRAAEAGNADAQIALADLLTRSVPVLQDGKPVPQRPNLDESAAWLTRAARQGNGRAQLALARCHETGRGVKRNPVEAYVWYVLASQNIGLPAYAGRDRMEQALTKEQRAEAEQRINNFVARPEDAPPAATR